jgi:hypothetical protein
LNNNELNFKGILPLGVESKEVIITPKMAKKILQGEHACGWLNSDIKTSCDASYKGMNMPKGWKCLNIFTENSLDGEVDGTLCPAHAKAIRALLKDELKRFTCGWQGCEAHFIGLNIPLGWRQIALYYEPKIEGNGHTYERTDGVLCPKHLKVLAPFLGVGYRLELMETEEHRSEN